MQGKGVDNTQHRLQLNCFNDGTACSTTDYRTTPLSANEIITKGNLGYANDSNIYFDKDAHDFITSNQYGFVLHVSINKLSAKKSMLQIGLFKPTGSGAQNVFSYFNISDINSISGKNFKLPSKNTYFTVTNPHLTFDSNEYGMAGIMYAQNGNVELGRLYKDGDNIIRYGSYPTNKTAYEGWNTFQLILEEN